MRTPCCYLDIIMMHARRNFVMNEREAAGGARHPDHTLLES
jgi:hypothetical protein